MADIIENITKEVNAEALTEVDFRKYGHLSPDDLKTIGGDLFPRLKSVTCLKFSGHQLVGQRGLCVGESLKHVPHLQRLDLENPDQVINVQKGHDWFSLSDDDDEVVFLNMAHECIGKESWSRKSFPIKMKLLERGIPCKKQEDAFIDEVLLSGSWKGFFQSDYSEDDQDDDDHPDWIEVLEEVKEFMEQSINEIYMFIIGRPNTQRYCINPELLDEDTVDFGLTYLTMSNTDSKGVWRVYDGLFQVLLHLDTGKFSLHGESSKLLIDTEFLPDESLERVLPPPEAKRRRVTRASSKAPLNNDVDSEVDEEYSDEPIDPREIDDLLKDMREKEPS